MFYALIFALFPTALVVLYLSKRYYYFITGFFITLFIQPVFQKLGDPTMYGSTFDYIGLARVQTNLIIILGLFFIIIILKIKHIKYIFKLFNKFFLVFIFLGLLNVLFALNIQKSFYLSIVSLLGPYLFFLVLIQIPEKYFMDEKKIIMSILSSTLFFFTLGLFFYYRQLSLIFSSGIEYIRGGGGLWTGNVSTQILAPFYPLIFLKSVRKRKFIFYTLIFLFFIFIIVSLSRTSTVVYSLIAIYFLLKIKTSRLKRVMLMIVIFLSLYFISFIILPKYGINIDQLYSSRFERNGTVLQTTLADERLQLSKIAFDKFLEYPLFGVGIGNFIEINSPGYTNSHNIFTNILVERGLFIFGLFMLFIVYFLRLNSKDIKLAIGNSQLIELLWAIKYGFIAFFLIGLTTNDLFMSSGFVNAWSSYILIFFTVIQLKIYANYSIKEKNS